MATEPKLCVNCQNLNLEMKCTKYAYEIDLVTGNKMYLDAKYRRTHQDECGYEAKDYVEETNPYDR